MATDFSFIDKNRLERERLKALVARLNDRELSLPLGGGWTVAAALAHLAFWDRRALILIEKWEQSGVAPSATDTDIINEALLTFCLALPPREAARLALECAEAIDRKLESIPAEMVEAIRAAGNPINLPRGIHRAEHIEEIEAALAKR